MGLHIGFISTIICAVVASCFGRIITQNGLQQNPPFPIQSRVIGGDEVPEGLLPYIVAINNTFGEHVCGGSIVTSKYVLTAAHCLKWPAIYLRVLTGAVYLNAPDAVYTVEENIVHCSYNKPWMHNDIGLILLKEEIVFNSVTQPIQMDTNIFLQEDETLMLSGWGAIKTYGRSSPILRTVKVKSISEPHCRESVKVECWLGSNNICTSTKHRRGSCVNDSGGPLVSSDGILVGVVNWGEACATGRPDVYSSVAHHYDFIVGVINGRRGC